MRPLRVGVDVTAWRNPRGDGRFVRNAVTRLVGLYPEIDWVLVGDAETATSGGLPGGTDVRVVRMRRAVGEAASARRPVDLLRLAGAARSLDAFLSPSVYSYFPVLRIPSVVGLHDANSMQHGKLVLPSPTARLLWRAKQALAIRRATRLFTVSRSARDLIAERIRVPASGIAVVPEAPDPAFEPQPRETVARELDALGLSREEGYFLFSAGLSPHKGLDTLVEAYFLLRQRRADVPPLVLVGSQEELYASAADAVARRVAQLGIGEAVHLPGFVSDGTLASLYTGATAVTVPSLGEGFGLPAVEAAACGAPTVLSDIGAHRETLEGAALFVPPGNADALAAALERVIDEPGLRESLVSRARVAVARLSWDETARRLHGLLQEAARRTG